MNNFTVFAHGETFDVDAYLATTSLKFDHIWRRGDIKRFSCVGSRHPTSGVEIELGDGRTVPFQEQEGIAINFLKAHEVELCALSDFPGVKTFVLGLQYNVKLDDNLLGFSMGPSLRLMSYALDIGIEPTYYVWLDRCDVESETGSPGTCELGKSPAD